MNTKILPYLFLSAGAMLRLVGLTVSPFWYDEAYSVYLSRLPDLMIRLEFSDFNPPLWQDEFGVPRASLETIPHRRVWVVWARDVLMTTRAVERMKAYIHGGILVGRVHYWQAPDIEVYLVSK